jgi:putative transposase
MKDTAWPTASEIGRALEVHVTSVRRRATKEGWLFIEAPCNGGVEKRFDPASLPKEVWRRVKGHREASEIGRAAAAISVPPGPEDSATPDLAKLNLPVAIEQFQARPAAPAITEAQRERALAKADLLKLYTNAIAAAPRGQQTTARDEFIVTYNAGLAWPTLFAQIGRPVHWKTIEGWKQRLKNSRNDAFALADTRGACHRGKHYRLEAVHTETLLAHALVPGKRKISEAIRLTRSTLAARRIPVQCSDATIYRWLEDWKSRHFDLWVMIREGRKAWSEQCEPYTICDYSNMAVGDALVADGHPLNFRIINPWTGKAQNHMTLLLFSDMLSTKPLGWEIMPTENTAAIHAALRRAIIALGKIPKKVYLDNGKAFRGAHFKSVRNFDEVGFEGLYSRLGIGVSHAMPYNAKAKPIERFFESFGELERLLYPVYTGTSIDQKPPRMHRGERMHREAHAKVFGEECAITMEQAHVAIAAWFDEYSRRPSRSEHLAGATPQEVFMAGRGPGVDPAELTFLMMSIEGKRIRRGQITHNGGMIYRHKELYGQDREVSIRYDLQDPSVIYVYNPDGSFLCAAPQAATVDRMADLVGDEAVARLADEMGSKRGLEKQTTVTAKAILEQHVLVEHRRQMETIGALPAPLATGRKEKVRQLPAPKMTVEECERKIAEAEEAGRMFAEREAAALAEELMGLSEADRYEWMIEMEMKGEPLTQEQRGFLRVYEQGDEYLRNEDYWTSRRSALAILYGQKEMAADDAAAKE